jgi:hypothetical protein
MYIYEKQIKLSENLYNIYIGTMTFTSIKYFPAFKNIPTRMKISTKHIEFNHFVGITFLHKLLVTLKFFYL